MSEAPLVRLGDCCEIVAGATPSTSVDDYWGGEIAWATPKDLSDLDSKYISATPQTLTDAGYRSCSAKVMPAGAVLFSSRAPIGHVAINTVPMCTNQGFKSLVPDPERVCADYLYHWLKANKAYLQSLGNGATFKEVSKAIVAEVRIPLLPLAEQRRIAAILDKADALRVRRREAIVKLDQLLQSMFIDMFGDPATNPMRWPIGTIADLLESLTYGSSEKADLAGEVPILRMNNLTYAGEIDLTSLKYISAKKAGEKHLVRPGDILFNRTNSKELVGKTAVYEGPTPMAFAGYLVRGRVAAGNAPEYIGAFMNSAYAKTMLRNMCKSIVGMANINAREFASIEIPVPPRELQKSFQQTVAAIKRRKRPLIEQQVKLDRLFSSLQQQAFSGAL